MTRQAALLGVVASLALALSAACGVPLQSTAEPLPPNVLPAPLAVPSPSPSPSPSTTSVPSTTSAPVTVPTAAVLRLWFVKEDGLAAVPSDLIEGASPDLVVQALAIGPTPEQTDGGLRTVARDPLTGLALVTIDPPVDEQVEPSAAPASGPPASPDASAVSVRLGAAFSALPPAEQVLLLGQVVLSLTGSGVPSVAFTDEAGAPVAVPLPDGRLLVAPATARDYASLIVQP